MIRLPRIRAATLAGTGAGGSLSAAAFCMLVLGAATMSFVSPGSPEVDEPTPRARLTSPPKTAARPPSGAQQRADPRTAAPPLNAPRAAGSEPPPRTRARRRRAVETEQRGARPVAGPASPPAPPTSPPQAEPTPPAPEPTVLRGRVEAAAEQARRAGESVAVTTSRVSPQAGELVRETTGTAAGVVEDIAQLLP